MFTRVIAVACLALCPLLAHAQDRRQVSEPVIPPQCVALAADKTVGSDRKIGPADEGRLDTARIQAALDRCPAGTAVTLAVAGEKNAFVSGPLELRAGITLQVGEGATLFASSDPAVFDTPGYHGYCGTIAAGSEKRVPGCRPLIRIADAKNTAIMGPGAIDGRGDMPLRGQSQSWWQKARQAEPNNQRLYSVRLIVASNADGLILYKIRLHNSPNFHVTVNKTDGFTAWDVHLHSPTVAGTDARNTDGIDPGESTNITVAHSWITTDDDNIAIKYGVSYMSVLHNHFYQGHGMSIGSEADRVHHVLVDDLTLDHTTSGIRIKSNVTRGGPVSELVYQNVCMRDIQVPIAISPYYMGQTIEKFVDPGLQGLRIPDYKAITLRNVTIQNSGDILIAGIDEAHRTEVTLDNVHAAGIKAAQVHLRFADITDAGTNMPLPVTGNAVKVSKGKAAGAPSNCEGKFLPMR